MVMIHKVKKYWEKKNLLFCFYLFFLFFSLFSWNWILSLLFSLQNAFCDKLFRCQYDCFCKTMKSVVRLENTSTESRTPPQISVGLILNCFEVGTNVVGVDFINSALKWISGVSSDSRDSLLKRLYLLLRVDSSWISN